MQILETQLKQLDTRWQRSVVYRKALQNRSSFTRSNYTNSPENPPFHKEYPGIGAESELYRSALHLLLVSAVTGYRPLSLTPGGES